MWDMLVRTPRGRISTRKYLSVAIVFITVCFAYIFATAPTTHAADAQWKGDTISYQQHTYKKDTKPATGSESHGLPKDTVIYRYTESAGSGSGGATQKAYLIYFAPGTDPSTASTATYQTFSLLGQTGYSNPSLPIDITLEPSSTATPAATSENPGTTSCAIDGIGWIICPFTNFLARSMDAVYGWVADFLEVRPLATTQDQALYRAWSYMRTFANIAFIIGFLVIIYSQISNFGLSNYNIKKMLPRIVIAAVLVNISYWICAAAVDISNILGYSVQDLFMMIRNSLVGDEGNSWNVISWESMSSLIISGGSVVGGVGIAGFLGITTATTIIAGPAGVAGLIALLLPLLLSVLFVVLMTFLILAARQAIITILIIIAPLAFVAFLLPNTEKWFEKWRSTLFTLLLLFPAFSLVFGGSQLAAAAIIQNAANAGALNIILLGMAVQVAPLAITPLLLKLGGGVLNRFAGIVNNPTKGMFDRGKNWARERTEQNTAAGKAALAERAKRMGYPGARPTSPHRGLRGRAANARMRLNPNNMAYAREYNRRRREEGKSADEAMAGGLFTQTGAGRRIDHRNKDANLEKHYGEATNLESYNRAVYGPDGEAHTYRSALHQDAHTASGRAKLIEDRATAHAERDLQTQINTDAVLRNTKIQTDVDSAHSKLQTASVEADAKLEFQNQVDTDRALKVMKVATFVAEQQATSIDNRLTKNAEARWNQLSRTDPNLQELRFTEVRATDSAKRVEEQWNSMLANIRATGSAAPYLAPQNARLADSIKGLAQDLSVEAEVQESAKIKQQEVLGTELKANAALRMYAGGVTGASGAARVFAKARSGLVSSYMDNVKNQRSTLSEYSLNELLTLSIDGKRRDGSAATDEEIDAAYQEVLLTKGNNWAFQKLKDNVREKGMHYDEATNKYYNDYDRATDTYSNEITNPDEVERRRTQQQIFVDAANQSKLKIASLSGTDRGDMETGTFTMSSEDAIIRDIREKKINANRLSNTDIDELMRTVQVLRDDTARTNLPGDAKMALQNTIEFALTDPQVRASIDDRAAEVMGVIHSYITDDRSVIPLADKQAYEDLASTKIFTAYDPKVPYDPRNDPRGPA